ncbi:MAG: lipoprotein-releasing ABC transporter permease subunit [Gammaproteobacteria bacterium]|nr:MAG: lipoprotein-releasing ABC transporter permease subunit [Gammaproteobacteria bacterium]
MLRQPYELSIAVRYLRATSRHGFISFISLVSMIGIGLAVAVLSVVLSVVNGFESELQQRILGIVSHAAISGVEGPLEDWEAMREIVLARPDVTGVAPYVEGQGLVVFDGTTAGINVRGIIPALEQDVSRLGVLLRDGDLEALQDGSYTMLVGSSLAAELRLKVGDSLVLMIAQGSVTPAGVVPRMRSFEVAGIFEAGMYEFDRGLVYISLADAGRLFRTDGRPTGLRLAVTDIYLAQRISEQVAIGLGGGFIIDDWTRHHGNFFRSIQITKSIMFVIFSMVVAVAVFNIVSTLAMVVRDKRGDIAILQSFGASTRSIIAMFATQGALIGVIGTVFGLALGILISSQLEGFVNLMEVTFGIDLLAAEVYLISDLPTQIRYPEIAKIGLLAISLAVLATLYPAISASRQPPAEALRYE